MINRQRSMRRNPILREVTDLLITPILIFALYVQWHGDYGPGGGFQAGVIYAAGIIVYALIYGLEPAQRLMPPSKMKYYVAGGWLLYLGTGFLAMSQGGEFLNYSALHNDPHHGQHYGILAIELGVGITVAAVMVTIFYAFAGRRSQ